MAGSHYGSNQGADIFGAIYDQVGNAYTRDTAFWRGDAIYSPTLPPGTYPSQPWIREGAGAAGQGSGGILPSPIPSLQNAIDTAIANHHARVDAALGAAASANLGLAGAGLNAGTLYQLGQNLLAGARAAGGALPLLTVDGPTAAGFSPPVDIVRSPMPHLVARPFDPNNDGVPDGHIIFNTLTGETLALDLDGDPNTWEVRGADLAQDRGADAMAVGLGQWGWQAGHILAGGGVLGHLAGGVLSTLGTAVGYRMDAAAGNASLSGHLNHGTEAGLGSIAGRNMALAGVGAATGLAAGALGVSSIQGLILSGLGNLRFPNKPPIARRHCLKRRRGYAVDFPKLVKIDNRPKGYHSRP